MATGTKQQASERLIDLILQLVIENEALDNKPVGTRIINSTSDGTEITYNETSEQSIIYGEDYRLNAFSQDLISHIELVVDDCLKSSDEYIILTDYSLMAFNLNELESEGLSEDYDAVYNWNSWISFSVSDGDWQNGGGASNGAMTCTSYPDPLILTTEVLEALSQFVNVRQQQTIINTDTAQEVLDTTIYELLPGSQTRQERIAKLFTEFNDLLGPAPIESVDGSFNIDVDNDAVNDTWDDLTPGQEYWHEIHGIHPDTNPHTGNIIRLEDDATNHGVAGQSLESMRNIIDNYLRDLDFNYNQDYQEERTEVVPGEKSYLQVRHMNQAIIVRNEEGKDLGIVGDEG